LVLVNLEVPIATVLMLLWSLRSVDAETRSPTRGY
jgi:hypothetical protein